MSNNAVYVTKKGLKKLEDELSHLVSVKRQEVANRLHEAIEDGELIENAEYEAAKNEQAFIEGRILELEHIHRTNFYALSTANTAFRINFYIVHEYLTSF